MKNRLKNVIELICILLLSSTAMYSYNRINTGLVDKYPIYNEQVNTNYLIEKRNSLNINNEIIQKDTVFLYTYMYLDRFAVFADPHRMPQFIDDGFYYTNIETGEILIPKRFDEAYPFVNNSALVGLKDKYAVIDTLGNYIIKPQEVGPTFNQEFHYQGYFGDYYYNFDNGEKSENGHSRMRGGRPMSSDYIIFKENEKYGIKQEDDDALIVEAYYDSISYFNIPWNLFVIYKNNKVGLLNIDSEKKQIEPEYDSIIWTETWENENPYNYPPFYGLLKSGIWHYFRLDDHKPICKSQHKITYFSNHKRTALNPQVIGVYKIENKYNILYMDGSSLPENYDFLTGNGIYGEKDNIIYLINYEKKAIPYIKNMRSFSTGVDTYGIKIKDESDKD